MLENMRKIQERIDQIKKSCSYFNRRCSNPLPNKTFAATLSEATGQVAPTQANKKIEKIQPSPELRADIDNIVEKHAKEHKLPPEVIRSLIAVASGYNPNTIGKEGQLGLMQVKPEIFKQFGFTNPFDPTQNISAGTRHLSQMLQRNGGDLSLALAAYYSDPATVKLFGSIPPFSDTQSFVSQILTGLRKNSSEK